MKKLFVAILKTLVNPAIKRPAATAPATVLDRSVSDAKPAQVEPVRHHRVDLELKDGAKV